MMLQIEINILSKEEEGVNPPLFYFERFCINFVKTLFVTILILFCRDALAATYTINNDVAGEVSEYTVLNDDTLYSIARKFDLGIVEIMAANPGVDPWIPQEGSVISLPTMYIIPKVKHKGVLINLSELRLFYFPDNKTVITFPVGIGREGWQTPVGDTSILLKRKNPSWIPPASILAEKPNLPKIVPPGPDNPMGQYALSLNWPGFAIHGTNKPHGIGLRSSHGCIRMYPEDIEALFNFVIKGTPVKVIDKAYTLGWLGDVLYLEVNPTQEQTDDIMEDKIPEVIISSEVYTEIDKVTEKVKIEVDWGNVDEALIKRTGIPVAIGVKK